METQTLSQIPAVPVEETKRKKFITLSPHFLIFIVSTVISGALFLLIVSVMRIPGILVLIAVSLSNGISQFFIHPRHIVKRLLWAIAGVVVSTGLIMVLSLILVRVFHA